MKFYAVRKGRNPGIFTTWKKAEQQVKGFKGAVFKSFPSEELAEEFLQGEEKKVEAKKIKITNIFYTDGSSLNNQNQKQRKAGWGTLWIQNGQMIGWKNGPIPNTMNQTNNIGELEAIRQTLLWISEEQCKEEIKIMSDSQYCINMFENWLPKIRQRGWKTSNGQKLKNKGLIQEIAELLQTQKVVFEHVKAHNGNKWNEMVDKLAKEGAFMRE